jgi:hypothetical protein
MPDTKFNGYRSHTMKLVIAFDIKDTFPRGLTNIAIPALSAFFEDPFFLGFFSDEHGLDDKINLMLPIWIKIWPSRYIANIWLFLS